MLLLLHEPAGQFSIPKVNGSTALEMIGAWRIEFISLMF